MDTAKQAIEALDGAAQRLRELVGGAATAGEDALVIKLLEAARSLTALGKSLQNGSSAAPNQTPHVSGGAVGEPPRSTDSEQGFQSPPRQEGGQSEPRGLPSRSPESDRPSLRRRAPRKGDYPKFFRRGDWLVKIGWSKKERNEYEHKAPRRVCDLLAAAMAKKGGSGRMFTVEDLIPLEDPQDGNAELPGYQVYVALAWFKSAGLVKVHGRRGYSVKSPAKLPASMTARWETLTDQNGQCQ